MTSISHTVLQTARETVKSENHTLIRTKAFLSFNLFVNKFKSETAFLGSHAILKAAQKATGSTEYVERRTKAFLAFKS